MAFFLTNENLLVPTGTFHLSVDPGAVMIRKHFCLMMKVIIKSKAENFNSIE